MLHYQVLQEKRNLMNSHSIKQNKSKLIPYVLGVYKIILNFIAAYMILEVYAHVITPKMKKKGGREAERIGISGVIFTWRRGNFQTARMLSLEVAPSGQSNRVPRLKYFSARRLPREHE